MARAEWIALIACIGTFLGLIHPALQIINSRKKKMVKEPISKTGNSISKNEEVEREKMSPYYKALVLTSLAVVIGLVGVIVYSWLADFFHVKIQIGQMPLNWTIGLVMIFIVPSLLLFLAFIHIFGTFDD